MESLVGLEQRQHILVDPSKNITAVLMTQVLHANPILKKTFYEFIYKNLNK